MFRVVTLPIIISTYNCNYSIVRSRKVAETGPYLSSLADFTHCIFRSVTSARCCNYSYMCSWWLVELPPETCRAKNFTDIWLTVHSCILLDNYWHWFTMHATMNIKYQTCFSSVRLHHSNYISNYHAQEMPRKPTKLKRPDISRVKCNAEHQIYGTLA
jgi:hypothetical protein